MFMPTKNITKKNQTIIFIFIHKISPKIMQDLAFFLQKNEFNMKRITKNYIKDKFALSLKNSNFILESNCKIPTQQLQNLISFLSQRTSIHGVFFKNQVLNVERIASLEKKTRFDLWKQIHSFNC